MKLAELECFTVANPPPHFGGRYFSLLEIRTKDGISGVGEVYGAPFNPHVVEKMIADVFERHLLEEDPFGIEAMWRRVYSRGYSQRPDGALVAVLSGLEMACWDIVGKACGKPVHALLGGRCRETLRAYSYLYPEPDDAVDVYMDADLAAERAATYAAKGFTAVKLDPLGPYGAFDPRQVTLDDLERCERFVAKIREAVGTRCDILFGTHGQMTPDAAIRLARRIEPYDPLWFEEPTPPENPAAMARVARATAIPVATGERLATKHEFARVLEAEAASILQPALGRVGGILETKKIAAIAESRYAQLAPHLYCGPIEGAANIQLAACIPNFLILESIRDWSGFHAEILEKPIAFEDGRVIPSDEPGLGVAIDKTVARAHPYRGDELHLEVASEAL